MFDTATIIYNPKSSGDGPKIAKRLLKKLQTLGIANEVVVIPTDYAGHAQVIAKAAAKKTKKPLIVSVSGDGGYNEVINGVIASRNKNAVCTVEAAGNANDHWRVVHHKRSLVYRLSNMQPRPISVLKLTVKGSTKKLRYAHSYIGFGMSAKVASALNKQEVTKTNEKKVLIKSILNTQEFSIDVSGKVSKVDSIIFANINEMAKRFKLDKQLHIDTADFRVIVHHYQGTIKRVAHVIGASVKANNSSKHMKQFAFNVQDDVWVQCDGESFKVTAGSKVVVKGLKDGIITI
jgi:diacylglycerol kinase (ATP)